MVRGPNGEVRKGDSVQRAVQVMRIATRQEQEVLPGKKRNSGLARAAALSPERKSEIGRKAGAASAAARAAKREEAA